MQKRSYGPWFLIKGNCGGHEFEVALPGLGIEFLPPRSTAKYQPLDLVVIPNTKVHYRSNLLRTTIVVNLVRFSGSNVNRPQVLLWSRLSVCLIGSLKRRMT